MNLKPKNGNLTGKRKKKQAAKWLVTEFTKIWKTKETQWERRPGSLSSAGQVFTGDSHLGGDGSAAVRAYRAITGVFMVMLV